MAVRGKAEVNAIQAAGGCRVGGAVFFGHVGGGRCTEGFLFATGGVGRGVGVSSLTKLVLSEVIRDPPSIIVFENSWRDVMVQGAVRRRAYF